MPTPGPNASNADKVKWILEGYEDPTKDTEETDTNRLQQDVAKVDIKDDELSLEEQKRSQKTSKMPVHPAEETTGGSITDKVAKESSDSNASTHPMHDDAEADKASSGGNLHANAHKANPGPVQADNLPTPESKEDLKKRAEELNK